MSKKNKQKDNRKSAARKNSIERKKIVQEEKKIVPTSEETDVTMEPRTPVWFHWVEKKTGINASSLKTLLIGVFCQIANYIILSNPAPEDVPAEVWPILPQLLVFLGNFIFFTGVFSCLYGVLSFVINKIKNKKKETGNEEEND